MSLIFLTATNTNTTKNCHDEHFAIYPEHDHHHHHDHEHDPTISSISLIADKPLNPEKFEAWIGDLRANKGQDLLRYKGILDIMPAAMRGLPFQGRAYDDGG